MNIMPPDATPSCHFSFPGINNISVAVGLTSEMQAPPALLNLES